MASCSAESKDDTCFQFPSSQLVVVDLIITAYKALVFLCHVTFGAFLFSCDFFVIFNDLSPLSLVFRSSFCCMCFLCVGDPLLHLLAGSPVKTFSQSLAENKSLCISFHSLTPAQRIMTRPNFRVGGILCLCGLKSLRFSKHWIGFQNFSKEIS